MSDTADDLAHDKLRAEINNLQADALKKLMETRLAPWQVAISGMTAGAAIVGAVVAVMKFWS
jgi:hypothetical protein